MNLIKVIKSNSYFFIIILFYLFLLIFNLPAKLILISFVILFLITNQKFKDIKLSLFFTFLVSTIVLTGKSYPIQLLPPDIFPEEIYPLGYFIRFTIKPQDIISFFMFIAIIREFFVNKKNIISKKVYLPDFLLLLYFFLKTLSSFYASQIPQISIIFNLITVVELIAYFYIKFLIKADDKFIKLFITTLSALVLFQSALAFVQLINKSPLYKNIESQVNIEYFGKVADEIEFSFRPLGTYEHANILGIWIASLIIFLIPQIIKNKSLVIFLSIFCGFLVLLTTLSRSAWLGFGAGIIFIYVHLYKQINLTLKEILKKYSVMFYICLSVVVLFITFFTVPRLQKSIYSFENSSGAQFFRKILIKDATQLIVNNPLLGVGTQMGVYQGISLNLYTYSALVPLLVHNWYVNTALETGFPSLIVYIIFILVSLKRYQYKKPIFRTLKLGTLSTIICLAVAGFFQPYINSIFILILLSISNNAIITDNSNEKN